MTVQELIDDLSELVRRNEAARDLRVFTEERRRVRAVNGVIRIVGNGKTHRPGRLPSEYVRLERGPKGGR